MTRQEQFKEVYDSVSSANWTTAAKECIDFGFWAKDLQELNEELELFDDLYDLVELIEIVSKIRYSN